jgi:ATP-dependent Clp protease ATP-binding subunit ClpA
LIDRRRVPIRPTHSFRPEFINRIDEIIVFQALTMEQLKQITRLMLDRTRASTSRTTRGVGRSP